MNGGKKVNEGYEGRVEMGGWKEGGRGKTQRRYRERE